MKTELDSFLTKNKNVIVVMTIGYPCVATREFLRLLADSRALKNALFLWISDHDPHAFQCYTTLKYGSAAMAWISPSTCVNRLELFGRHDFVILAATNSLPQVPKGIRSRFGCVVEVNVVTQASTSTILKERMDKFRHTLTASQISKIARKLSGLGARVIDNFITFIHKRWVNDIWSATTFEKVGHKVGH
ncbi:MAG: hypothetical protein LQ345_002972 [Seirophora villosa]|nr:MAG: hypothetical protein LQ345_002972 [Seirophora villosa]